MTTMKEIARETGVSISTVSLVLNGRDEGRVNAALAELVRKKADELGYRINPLARSLRTNRTRILGFISEEVATTPFAGGIILGAQDAASVYGYILFTVSTDGAASEEQEISTLKRYGVDGFLYSKMSNRIASVPASLNDYPVVMVDATDAAGKIPSVEPDEFAIAYDATNRLLRAHCERIAYIGCSENIVAQHGRLAGYRAALHDAGRDFDDSLVCDVMNNAMDSSVSTTHAPGMCTNAPRVADSPWARTFPWSASTITACSRKRSNHSSPPWNCRTTRWDTGPPAN